MVFARAAFYALGVLPSAAIGSVAWWIQKAPLIVVSLVVLAPIVAVVSGVERRVMLAAPTAWSRHPAGVFVLAATVSTALKLWSIGNVSGAITGMIGLVVAGRLLTSTVTPSVPDTNGITVG